MKLVIAPVRSYGVTCPDGTDLDSESDTGLRLCANRRTRRGDARYHLRVRVLGAESRRTTATDLPVRCERRNWYGCVYERRSIGGVGTVPSLLHRYDDVDRVLPRGTPLDHTRRTTAAIWRRLWTRTLRRDELHRRAALSSAWRRLRWNTLGDAEHHRACSADRSADRFVCKESDLVVLHF